MSDGMIEGFSAERLPGDGLEIDVLVGGSGPPLLLLHGFPQTRMCWRSVAVDMASDFTVVVPDLRGYGRSDKPPGDPDHMTYSKRAMAKDQVAVMSALGFKQFAVSGHDRGGRVAYRLALDSPGVVTRLAVLDILPTADFWASIDELSSVVYWHWSFLAQPFDLPERLIGADPGFFFSWMFEKSGYEFAPDSLADYLACARDPRSIHAMCEDYRSGWTTDRSIDRDEQAKITVPTLALWGEHGLVARYDPLAKWGAWADQLQGNPLPCGHFLPEEASDAVVAAFRSFFGAGT
jgi:haloacetate dehalogenase